MSNKAAATTKTKKKRGGSKPRAKLGNWKNVPLSKRNGKDNRENKRREFVAKQVGSIKELSERTGFTYSYVCRLVHGSRKPSFGAMVKMSTAMKVPVTQVVEVFQ